MLLSAFDARRRLLTRWGEGGLVMAGDDNRDLHRLQEFAERNHVPYRAVLALGLGRLGRDRGDVCTPTDGDGRGDRGTTRPG